MTVRCYLLNFADFVKVAKLLNPQWFVWLERLVLADEHQYHGIGQHHKSTSNEHLRLNSRHDKPPRMLNTFVCISTTVVKLVLPVGSSILPKFVQRQLFVEVSFKCSLLKPICTRKSGSLLIKSTSIIAGPHFCTRCGSMFLRSLSLGTVNYVHCGATSVLQQISGTENG